MVNVFSPSGMPVTPVPAVFASQTILAGANVAGLTVMLDTEGRPYKGFFASVGGIATVLFEVSVDGTTWRTLKSTLTVGPATILPGETELIQAAGYRHMRLTSATTGIDITFELTAI